MGFNLNDVTRSRANTVARRQRSGTGAAAGSVKRERISMRARRGTVPAESHGREMNESVVGHESNRQVHDH